jgi:sugar-specific transcriptional regulator TrmB
MIPALKKAIVSLGLNEHEAVVLMVLLEKSPLPVALVARNAGLNRTTTYGVLKQLSEKGLVSSAKREGAVRYQSLAPEQLPAYIERRRQMLDETKQQVTELIPQLKLLRSKGKSLPKVQFFEGEEGVKQAYEDTLENNKGKVLRNITSVDAIYTNSKLGGDWIEYYIKKRARLGIECRNLAPKSEWAKTSKAEDQKYLRVTKFLPPQYMFEGELDVYDNKVGIFSYARENPVALIIEDETVSDMMRKIFDCLEAVAE